MGRTAKETEHELQTKPSMDENNTVKVSEIKDYYESGSYSPAEVAEHFNVEEADVVAALGLDRQAEEADEFNQPKGKVEDPAPADK